jgi:P4 family phage/plasmid primase-like protien
VSEARDLLLALFSRATPGARIITRSLPSRREEWLQAHDPDAATLDILMRDRANGQFFGVVPRGKGVADTLKATAIWADVDAGASWAGRWYGLDALVPTAVVLTGKPDPVAHHLYWVLTAPIEVEHALRLVRLAQLAVDGDPKVIDAQRILRLPGSTNIKPEYGTPSPLVRLAHLDATRAYAPEALEEALVAQLAANAWQPGEGHAQALHLGALLARARWSEERVERTLRSVCEGEDDAAVVRDRVVAAVETVGRMAAGLKVSTANFREAVTRGGEEPKRWRSLVQALNVTADSGQVVLNGEALGHISDVERIVEELMLQRDDYRYADGGLVAWTDGTHWRGVDQSELVADIFTLQKSFGLINDEGSEIAFIPKAKIAHAVAGVLVGTLAARALDLVAPHLLPLRNGVLNLLTRELLPHGKEHRLRYVLDYDYDPEAACPTWLAFLQEALPDEAERRFLQEWFGYNLLSTNPFDRMYWAHGPSGTGKSTTVNALHGLLGPASVAISADKLDDYSLAALQHAKAAVCSEISSRTLKTPILKSITSGDPIKARHPYGRPFTLVFRGKVTWASNALPPVDQAEGLYRRLAVMGFVVKPKRRDVGLGAAIAAERPGVLNWAVGGLDRVLEYQASGGEWPLPESVQELVREYQDSRRPVRPVRRGRAEPRPGFDHPQSRPVLALQAVGRGARPAGRTRRADLLPGAAEGRPRAGALRGRAVGPTLAGRHVRPRQDHAGHREIVRGRNRPVR